MYNAAHHALPHASSGGGGGIGGLLHDLTSLVSGVVSGGAGVAQHAVGNILGISAGALLKAVDAWVAAGAVWLLDQVGGVLSSTTGGDLGSSWFGARLGLMSELAASVMLPMLMCAVIQAIYRQNAAALLRTFLVNLPIALLFTGVAVELVRVGIVVTDAMSARFMAAAGVDTRHLLAPVGVFLLAASAAAPGFAVFLASGLVAGTAMVLWVELVVRAAAITAAALFLPLVLAALVWPSIGHWARRLADTLAALVLSKLVIAAVISLAVGAVEGGLTEQGSVGTKFGDVVVGIALLLLATFSPFVLLRLIPAIESGAISHLEGTRHRLRQVVEPPMVKSGGHAYDLLKKASQPSPMAALPPVGEEAGKEPFQNSVGSPWPSGPQVADHAATLAPPRMQHTEVRDSKREGAIPASTRATDTDENPTDPERDV